MRPEAREYGLQHGYSPIAEKVVCVDFDGTLYPWGELYSYNEPMPGAVSAMELLKSKGFRIVIFTSRLSPTWLEAEGYSSDEMLAYIKEVLERDGIAYDDITSEKVPAVAYVDDKAIHYFGRPYEWWAIADDLVERYG